MSQHVHANPKDLRNFAKFLRQFSTNLENEAGQFQGKLSSLGSSWRDPKYREFERDMREMIKSLRKFSKSSEDYQRYLNKKASDLERYLGS